MIFLVNQKTNWDFPAKKKILDHYKKPRINLKRTIAVLGKLGFYLNYVGCKVALNVVNFFINSCFTLTMWDVKTKSTVRFAILSTFYLNYVGCKAILAEVIAFDAILVLP